MIAQHCLSNDSHIDLLNMPSTHVLAGTCHFGELSLFKQAATLTFKLNKVPHPLSDENCNTYLGIIQVLFKDSLFLLINFTF